MSKRLLAAFFLAVAITGPSFSQPAQPVATTEVVETTEQISVPPEAPPGSSGPVGVGVGLGVGAVVVVFGIMALGAVLVMGGSS